MDAPMPGSGQPRSEGRGQSAARGDSSQGQSHLIQAPAVSLPKGGGAIRGMGEKFAANPVTGTGSMTVPIATSPGRGGFGPELSLSYDSGAGDEPFGFGWSLSLPSITRKTDKGLPRYRDWSADPLDADVFVLSGAEDLVPVLRQGAAGLEIHEDVIDGYRVRRYRPRIEGLFARIERWQWIPTAADPRPEAEQRAVVHWRSISRDNILTIYGADSNSRIADPLDPERVFSWLICESRDDKGNGIRYLYKAEDGTFTLRPDQEDPFRAAHQRNRGAANDPARTAQRYLQRVLYGNRAPLLDAQGQRPRRLSDLANPPSNTAADWLFEVRFDYGELNEVDPTGTPEQPWFYRPDAFSSYRSGFEVRTCRRCERVLILHHIPGPDGYEGVVRSTDFTYDDELDPALATKPIYSFLKQVVQTGWKQENGTTTTKSLPPLEFRYSQPRLGEQVEVVDPGSLENLPIGLDGGSYRWVDLHGEGLPGILTEQAGAWFYKRNLSPISQQLRADNKADVVTFAALETVSSRPNVSLAGDAQILDLAGDGLPDVVTFSGLLPGLYEHDGAEGWQPFRPFRELPNINFSDPNLRFIDLDGDGHADLLVSEGEVFVWYRSMEEQGFEPAQRLPLPWDEDKGPRVVLADGSESIHLADMSGDGLTDVVRIRAGLLGNEICYWPNLGYGRFGAKVSMDNAPRFDHPELFDPKRLLLADIDGSGTTDLIYLHAEGVRLYFNQAGNSWSAAVALKVFPPIHNAAQVTTLDLLGNGTAALVWSSPLAGDSGRQMRYVPLMAEGKPHLLTTTINNLGAETRVQYCSSLRFYLEDKLNGKPWITRLPFPVQVVERVETIDHISRNRFVSRYAYHHGYFDGEEREFRGFGMVEQWDTEQLAALSDGGVPADNIAAPSHVPPVHTKTWFHTGVCFGRDHVSDYFAGLLNATDQGEYFREPGMSDAEARAQLLPDTVLPGGLTLEEEREACRALKGSMLRQEVYADDAGPNATAEQIERAQTPYTVTEQNFSIRRLQARGVNRHAVFFAHPLEALSYHYERNPADPRIQHALTLEVDAYGNVLKQAAIGYGRRAQVRVVDAAGNGQLVANPGFAGLDPTDQDQQTTPLLTYTENRVTNAIETADTHHNPLPCEAITFELTGYTASGLAGRFQATDFVEPDPAAAGNLRHKFTGPEVAYEATAAGNQRRRPIEQLRTLYRPNDMGAAAGNANQLLPLGQVESLALPGESYKLAFTPGLLDQVFQRPRDGQPAEELLPSVARAQVLGGQRGDQGGYVDLEGDGRWWLPSGRSFFSADPADPLATELAEARQHFYLPRRIRDPFGEHAFVEFDGHDLLMAETRDALNNRVTVESNDYRVLQPRLVSDPNHNQTEVAFDTLGMVVGTAVMGKPAPAPVEGDTLAGFAADLSQGLIDAFLTSPVEASADPQRTQATATTRGLLAGATTRIVYDLDRYRRIGQPAMAATMACETHVSDLAAGQESRLHVSFSYSDGFGREIQKKIQAEPGRLDPLGTSSAELNPRWVGSGWTIFNNKGKPVRQYEPFFSASHGFEFGIMVGVSPVLFYDPAERVVATLHPNHTWEKVVFDPWQQTSWDVNDTAARFDLVSRTASVLSPADDPDVGAFFRRLANDSYLPTWYELRSDAAKALAHWPDADANGNPLPDNAKRRASEKAASARAAAHAGTPTTAHFDSLGRPFLTVARNRVVCADHDLDGAEDSFATRVELDIEGIHRAVIDAKDRVVMRYAYDMLGNRIHQLSMDAGARWMLNDVAGNPIRAFDSRGHTFRTEYGVLRRPLRSFVAGVSPGTELVTDRIVYGEQHPEAELRNLRGAVYLHLDQAGAVIAEANDFKGNPLRASRQIVKEYKQAIDWSTVDAALPAVTALLDLMALEAALVPQLEAGAFTSSTTYDALNRPVLLTTPHTTSMRPSVIRPGYNEANLLERVDANLQGASSNGLPVWTPFVTNIDYDAKGQRQRIDYGNGVSTFYEYDPLTFRLIQLRTRRNAIAFPGDCPQPPESGWPGCQVQNLRYTYDPAGNITHIRDDAQQRVFFSNQRIEPNATYTYDATYRLIEATGREHLGQIGGAPIPHSHNDAPRVGIDWSANDGAAMGTYAERYLYDAVGNFLEMQHRGSNPAHAGWTRGYAYAEASLIEASQTSNRLSSTTVGGGTPVVERCAYDPHGNMTRMPHLGGADPGPNMHWDYRDQLRQADLGGGGTAYYVYDAGGQRVRKVWEKSAHLVEERIYLGGFEIFRRRQGGERLERETLHIMDGQQRIALVETRTVDTAGDDPAPPQLVRYQLGNHLGSASLELDIHAQIISYEEYTPYGSTSYQAVRSQTEIPKRYRYTGMERDEESGLTYHGARYCAPWLGRWASCDPTGLKDGVNLYLYVGSNPIGFTDPTGNERRAMSLPQMERRLKEINAEIAATEAKLARYAAVEANAKANLSAVLAARAEVQKKLEAARAEVITHKALAANYAAQAKEHAEDAQRHRKNATRAAGAAKFFGAILLAVTGCGGGVGCILVASGSGGAGASQVISAQETRNPIEEGVSKGFQLFGVEKETADLITQSAEAVYFLATSAYGIRHGSPTAAAIKGSDPISAFSACVGGAGPCVPNAVNSIRRTLGLKPVAMRQAAVSTAETAEGAAIGARMDALNLAKSEGALRLSSGQTRLALDGGTLVDADYLVITQNHALHLTVRNGAGTIVDNAARRPLMADSFSPGTFFYRVLGGQ